MKIISKSVEETEQLAKDFLEKISLGIYNNALVVGLYGDLGSGKTTFTQAIAKYLNIKEDITSPTFVIEKIYPVKFPPKAETDKVGFNRVNSINHHQFSNLIHIDAYRLDSAKELSALDWKRTMSDPRNIIFIEWPERVLEILPENHAKINFKFLSENEREIEI